MGTVIEKNMIANTCRESGDHGNFNSWDRQPFLTDVGSGVTPDYLEIRENFLISNCESSPRSQPASQPSSQPS